MSGADRLSLYLAESRIKGAGNGLFTRRGIKKGTVCVVFPGRQVHEKRVKEAERQCLRPPDWVIQRSADKATQVDRLFLMDSSVTLAGVQRGSAPNWYWMNSGSTSNMEMVKLLPHPVEYVWKAKRDIAANEELIWTYSAPFLRKEYTKR